MKRVVLAPSYILHRRAYRENSFLLELFTKEHGRISVIAKGIRRSRSSSQGILQPFVPLLVSFAGGGELMTLLHVETDGEVKHLRGECLFAGFYLNELLMCLLQKWDAHSRLYVIYERTLHILKETGLQQKTLRSFEKAMLEELGYGILPSSDPAQKTFASNRFYRFIPDRGFVMSEMGEHAEIHSSIFSGKSLLAISEEDWQDEQSLRDAKRLMRIIIAFLLGERPLYSRKLFTHI